MAIRTYGSNAVDWEQRVDLARLREQRLARARKALESSSLGALLTFAGTPPEQRRVEDGESFVRFFRLFANHYHHAREEDTLFAALRDRAGLPTDRGPVATMVADHVRMAWQYLRELGLEGAVSRFPADLRRFAQT